MEKVKITKKKLREVLDILDGMLEKHQTNIEPWADSLKNIPNTRESNGKS